MTLTEAREKLARDLQDAGLNAYDHVPARVNVPAAIVSADTPWIEPDDSFDGTRFAVNMRVLLVAQTSTNSVVTEALDDLVTKTVVALEDWDVNVIDQPGVVELNGTGYLGTYVRVSNFITIQGE